jgi:hypothetical protein
MEFVQGGVKKADRPEFLDIQDALISSHKTEAKINRTLSVFFGVAVRRTRSEPAIVSCQPANASFLWNKLIVLQSIS